MDFDVYEGVTPNGNGNDSADTDLLSVFGSGIRRIELYQPMNDSLTDGLAFDNLTFVPEPSVGSLFALGLIGLAARRRQRGGCRRARVETLRTQRVLGTRTGH